MARHERGALAWARGARHEASRHTSIGPEHPHHHEEHHDHDAVIIHAEDGDGGITITITITIATTTTNERLAWVKMPHERTAKMHHVTRCVPHVAGLLLLRVRMRR
jgi:hypothetical protein